MSGAARSSEEHAELLESARAFFRGHVLGELRFDEHLRPVKVVIGPDGRVIGPVMVAMLESADTVLFLPQADDEAMQVMVSLERFDESGPMGDLADRWRIYHGEPDDVRWAVYHIDAVRFGGAVIDGEHLLGANPLAEIEPRLCREINSNRRSALREAIRTRLDLRVDEPVLVGIDPYGLDVRGPFDIIRLAFNMRLDDVGAAEAHVMNLLEDAAS